jgi:hypothetical protein
MDVATTIELLLAGTSSEPGVKKHVNAFAPGVTVCELVLLLYRFRTTWAPFIRLLNAKAVIS